MSLPLQAGTYVVDPMHSQFVFEVTHLGITPITGLFSRYSGALVVGDDAASSSFQLDIEMASIQSGNGMRDEHLLGEAFFDVANHPTMTFRSTSLTAADGGWKIAGDLVVRGTSQALVLDGAITGASVHPMDKQEHVGVIASGAMSRLAGNVGAAIPEAMLSDTIPLAISVQLIRQQ